MSQIEGNQRQPAEFRLCKLHEDLGALQPRLEFQHPTFGWVKSGLKCGRLSKSLLGKYREVLQTP